MPFNAPLWNPRTEWTCLFGASVVCFCPGIHGLLAGAYLQPTAGRLAVAGAILLLTVAFFGLISTLILRRLRRNRASAGAWIAWSIGTLFWIFNIGLLVSIGTRFAVMAPVGGR